MKAVLIVEGANDEKQIKKAFNNDEDIITLVTEGTKMNCVIEAEIENYLRQGVKAYILSDPDKAGDTLAKMVQERFPDVPRLNVNVEDCGYFTGKKMKAGIEYASYDFLKELISPLIGRYFERKKYPINWD